jgi:hypothetical protein
MTTKKFGLTTYDEPAQTGGGRRQENSNDEKFEFLRLKDGENRVRCITNPYKYYQVRFKATEDEKGWGKKIRCSSPVENDPAVKSGAKAKERWLVGVIDRADGKVKIWDYHVLVYKQVKGYNDDIDYGDPQNYDLKVDFDKDAPALQQVSIRAGKVAPLSEADVSLRDGVLSALENALARHSAPLKPETVIERMKECGWDGESPAANGASNSKSLPDTGDDDYSFDQPAAQA